MPPNKRLELTGVSGPASLRLTLLRPQLKRDPLATVLNV